MAEYDFYGVKGLGPIAGFEGTFTGNKNLLTSEKFFLKSA